MRDLFAIEFPSLTEFKRNLYLQNTRESGVKSMNNNHNIYRELWRSNFNFIWKT
jgi:hypothetical protein